MKENLYLRLPVECQRRMSVRVLPVDMDRERISKWPIVVYAWCRTRRDHAIESSRLPPVDQRELRNRNARLQCKHKSMSDNTWKLIRNHRKKNTDFFPRFFLDVIKFFKIY